MFKFHMRANDTNIRLVSHHSSHQQVRGISEIGLQLSRRGRGAECFYASSAEENNKAKTAYTRILELA